ncbi:prolipoprotein diacylglyceryl transferase [Endozoicomonas euniceicola]|uniref:Uncharacterized protein n=1 Tax=Endozoicomonas euniceicola TaxID=1234143 RepID=A0ABY6GRC5_9GAMM|nr:hypothetical protein [Endozoicomonas euniceicola]UYM15308.1 hypothetical protein NX720_21010 [Endozoicomonas euniceicola]
MNVISGVMSVFLAGLSASVEAQLTLGSTKPLNAPFVFKGMEGFADFPVPGKEAGSKPPSIEIGDISLRNGIKARNIRLYGSSDPYDLSTPLPGLDQALAGCDGNQAKGWVSYDAVTISCSQGGVEAERTLPLPPSTQKALSLVMETRGKGSKMLIAKNPQKARLVVDDSMLTATSKILTAMQFGSPFANTTYAVGNVRQFKDNDSKERLFVDLCLVDEEDLNQPATDGNSFSKKGGTGFSFKCGSSKNQNSDSEGGEFPEEGGGSQSPGGNGGDDGDPDKNNPDNKPGTLMLLSVEINLEQLIKALEAWIKSATQEQRVAIKVRLGLLAETLKLDTPKSELTDQELSNLWVSLLQASSEHLQLDDGTNAHAVQNLLTELLQGIASGQALANVLQSLRDTGVVQQLQDLSFEPVDLTQDDEASQEAATGNVENDTQTSGNISSNWQKIINSLLEIAIKPEDSEHATDDQTPPEDQANSEKPRDEGSTGGEASNKAEAPEGSQANTEAEAPAAGSEAKKESEAPEGSQANNGIQTSSIPYAANAEFIMLQLQHPKFYNKLRKILERREELKANRKNKETACETTGDNTTPEGKEGDPAKSGQNQKTIRGAIT